MFEELEELEEERLAEEEVEEVLDEEILVAREESKGGIRQDQLNVVASTIQTATNSVSGTISGTSIHATGNTAASGGSSLTSTSTISAASSSGGMSMSSSPSISAQVQSAAIQTNTILDMSSAASSGGGGIETTVGSSGDTAIASTETTVASDTTTSTTSSGMTTTIQTFNAGTMTASAQAQTSSIEAEISTAIGGEMSASEADLVADQIIADNIAEQQEQLEEAQEETGEYADATTLIAYMGFVPGFDSYKQVTLPEAAVWYESREIYANVKINDNTTAFFGLYSDSLTGLQNLQKLQPNL